jgi:formylglycine-generating enzyme required for sulfatase activity
VAVGGTPVQRSRIFISYRRQDAEQAAGRLADDLRRHFEPEQIFEDIASIEPGADFEEALQQGLASCAAVIVVMGPAWATITDKQGRRRIELADDWVRQEVAHCLQSPGVGVFPVLVGDAHMPNADELPEALRPLTRRQAYPLTTRHWPKDVAVLVEHLKRILGLAQPPVAPLPQEPADQKDKAPRKVKKAAVLAVPKSLQALAPGTVFRDCDIGPEMVVIPAGSFMMGSPSNEQGRKDNEGPQHSVNIPRQFAVGKYQITFEEWDACVREGGCSHNPGDEGWGRGRRPVINVSWNDTKRYTQWLSSKTGNTYRLLTEAEWEYVVRAGTTTPFDTGTNISPTEANYNTDPSVWTRLISGAKGRTMVVGNYQPNRFGLYDVHGNVSEWTEDCWNENYEGAPGDGTARTTGDCGQRVLRGGSWVDFEEHLRSAVRESVGVAYRGRRIGFRVTRTL